MSPPKWQQELADLTTEIRTHVDYVGNTSVTGSAKTEWDKEFARILGEIFELGWDSGIAYGRDS